MSLWASGLENNVLKKLNKAHTQNNLNLADHLIHEGIVITDITILSLNYKGISTVVSIPFKRMIRYHT